MQSGATQTKIIYAPPGWSTSNEIYLARFPEIIIELTTQKRFSQKEYPTQPQLFSPPLKNISYSYFYVADFYGVSQRIVRVFADVPSEVTKLIGLGNKLCAGKDLLDEVMKKD